MPIIYYSDPETGKWGIKDVEGDVVLYPCFDSVITSDADLNYTKVSVNGEIGYLILSPEPAERITKPVSPYLHFRLRKGMLFSVFFKDTAAGRRWISLETLGAHDKTGYIRISELEEQEEIARTPTERMNEEMYQWMSKNKAFFVPPGNTEGVRIFLEIYEFLLSAYAAAVEDMEKRLPFTEEEVLDSLCSLPTLFFGNCLLSEMLEKKMESAPADISETFAEYLMKTGH